MLAQAYTTPQEDNQKTPSRIEELIEQYESPVKALVHSLLEQYVHEAFNEFMSPRVGQAVSRGSDGSEVVDYRNGFRTVKQLMVDDDGP